MFLILLVLLFFFIYYILAIEDSEPNGVEDEMSMVLRHAISWAPQCPDDYTRIERTEKGLMKFVQHESGRFERIRAHFGYSSSVLAMALRRPLEIEISPGKSASSILQIHLVFLHTHCKKFLFKTLQGDEPKSLCEFMSDYQEYLLAHPNSMLPRYLGLYSIERLDYFDVNISLFDNKSTFVLMANWFDTDLFPILRFDFKGSSVGRQSIAQSEMDSELNLRTVTLKELDFLRLLHLRQIDFISMEAQVKELFVHQLQNDLDLLSAHSFMDYSLLVGVYQSNELEHTSIYLGTLDISVFRGFHNGIYSDNTKCVYFFGLVDILQKYNLRKRIERGLKRSTSRLRATAPLLTETYLGVEDSVEAPERYASRLLEFMNKVLM
jgi:hypothetical protein